MAASVHSPAGARENTSSSVSDHCQYLDHPHRRACFPSLTEFPDSPSVYSHVYHSPDADVHSGTASISRLSDPPGNPSLDDETAFTIRSLSTEDVPSDPDVDDHTDDTSHRISLQGPKIRFHSRAPWEIDDAISHGKQSDNSSRSATIGIKSKLKGKPSRTDNLIRTFTRGSSVLGRPSVDSAYSQISVASSATTSFEFTAGNCAGSRSALYGLVGQSKSTSSLSSAASASVRRESFAHAANYPKPSHYLTHAVSLDGKAPSTTLESAATPPSSFDASRISNERSAKSSQVPLLPERQSHDKFVHPYANPDLVIPYTPSPETAPSHPPVMGDMGGSDTNSTVTDSTSTRSAALSVISSGASTTSSHSRDLPHGHARVNGKEISSPISVLRQGDISYVDRDNRFLSLHPPPTGFDSLRRDPRSPTVTLISLQEAQERERFRSNTVHTTVTPSKPSFPNLDDISETKEDRTEETHAVGIPSRIRARSSSIGTQYKTIPLRSSQQIAEMREESAISVSTSTVPRRVLKHKKSGFMRLFGGRNSEEDKERSPPPPIPLLGEVYAEQNSQIHGLGKISKVTPTKVLKPPLSPPLSSGASNTTLASTNSTSSWDGGVEGRGPCSRRRQPPSLSIVTKTSDHSISTSVTGQISPTGSNFASQPPTLTVPQSAPACNGDFPGLKLRPVSTSFSSHFAGLVAGTMEDLQHGADTPSSTASSGTALSPFTPISTRRSDDASSTAVETLREERLTIKELQDQLASVKKAWQQQILELRGQIRDLTSELEDLRAADRVCCEVCGRGEPQRHQTLSSEEQQPKKIGVVNRPRARTGDTARFAGD